MRLSNLSKLGALTTISSLILVGCSFDIDQQVTYRNRHYINPDSSAKELKYIESKVGKLYPTGEMLNSYAVYEFKGYNPDSPRVPTILVLKSPGGKFIVYFLSGGP